MSKTGIVRTDAPRGTSIEDRKRRWRRLLGPDAEPGFLFVVRLKDPDDPEPATPPIWPAKRSERIEWILKTYERALDRVEWLADDSIPYLDMLTGTEIFGEALGCPVYRPEFAKPSAQPAISKPGEVASVVVPDIENSSLAYLFEMADELRERAGSDALIRCPDAIAPADMAFLVWNRSDMLVALLEEPDAVHELISKAASLLIRFFDMWFSRYGIEHIAHYPDYLLPNGISVSEDEVGLVSPDLFEEFFLPPLSELSVHFGFIGIHCCAESRHQWESFLRIPNLTLVNITKPPLQKGDFIIDAGRFFAGKCVFWPQAWRPDLPLSELQAQFPPESRIVLEITAKSRDEAARIADTLNELREEGIS